MKCKCGNDKFYALQRVVRMDVVEVDAAGRYLDEAEPENHHGFDACVDYSRPEGPFICTECGAEYEDLDDDAEPVLDDE